MAAHVYTALNQLKDELARNNQVHWGGLQVALDYSCWTEDLTLEDYRELATITATEDLEGFRTWLQRITPEAAKEWERLGMPTTREEWVQKLYDECFGS